MEENHKTMEEETVEHEEASDIEKEQPSDSEQDHSEGDVNKEIEELKKQSEENYNRFLRVQADFDNFRRRTVKEKEETAKFASSKVIEQLIPVMDNFERAISAGEENSDNDSMVEGVKMVFKQIEQIFEKEGVEPIPAEGEAFDPNYHQAVMQVESDEHDAGIVVEELQKGYKMKGRVLRPSMVKVSS